MSSSFCHFYIVRHGQSEGNALRVVQGHADYSLTNLGIQQAHSCSNQLGKIQFADCFASDLLRAKETAEIIASYHKIAVNTTQLLREQNFGRFNDSSVEFFEKELDSVLAEHRKLGVEQRRSQRAHPEIESDDEMMARMLTFLRSTALVNLNKNVLVVSHGAIMRSLLTHLGFATFEQLSHSSIGNCAYIELDCDGIEFFVRSTTGITVAE